jgi:hypothetical protein
VNLRRIAFLAAGVDLCIALDAEGPLRAQPWHAGPPPCAAPPSGWMEECGWGRPQPPPISFSADVLVLDRTDVDSHDFMFTVGGGVPVLNTRDVHQATGFSSRYDLIFHDESGWDLEFELLGFPEDRDGREVRADAGTLTFDWFGAVPATPVTSYTVEYESQMRGGAVNMRWRVCPWLTLTGGVRYLGLHEDFDILETATIGTGTTVGFFSSVSNDLYGGQLGGEFLAITSRYCRLSVSGAVGSYANRQKVYAIANDGGGTVVLDRRDTSSSFLSEARAVLEFPVFGAGTLRFGYQAYWLTDVLLATNQSDNFDILTNTGSFDRSSPMYQGGFVGLGFRF